MNNRLLKIANLFMTTALALGITGVQAQSIGTPRQSLDSCNQRIAIATEVSSNQKLVNASELRNRNKAVQSKSFDGKNRTILNASDMRKKYGVKVRR